VQPKSAESWTVGRLLDWTAGHLRARGIESSRLEAELLLAHALGCRRIDLYARYLEDATDAHRQRFKELIQQRLAGTPVAYLVGRREFFSLDFEVTPAVLIPRADTETLVVQCLRLAKPMSEPTILDVGTGSGCIAVTVAHQHKTAHVTAVDVSPDALAVAVRNAERHKLTERIRFLQSDLFAALPDGDTFDFILSNPPYITHAEMALLQPSVRDHEPRLALDGGADGFTVLTRLITEAMSRLKPGGYLLIEIGSSQDEGARQRLATAGYEVGKTLIDGSKQPRVVVGRRPQ
jgi:release factor glutamine methyltransferase